MESLDRAFENVCELDLIFHFDEVGFPSATCLDPAEGRLRSTISSQRSYRAVSYSRPISTRSQHAVRRLSQGLLVLPANEFWLVQASSRNRKASAASANPLLPSLLSVPGSGGSRRLGRGGSADGPRRWLAAMGV